MKIVIIGTGCAGTAFTYALHGAGYEIIGFVTRNIESARECLELVETARWTDQPEEIVPEADIVFLTVPDDTIKQVANILINKKLLKEDTYMFHASGALPSAILKVRRRASIHPVASLAKKRFAPRTFFAIEGTQDGVKLAKELVRSIRGIPFLISPEKKLIYHVSLVLAGPLLTNYIDEVRKIFHKSGTSCEIFERYIYDVLKIYFNMHQKLKTGPFERMDKNLLMKEIKLLEKINPSIAKIFDELGRL